MVVRVFQLQRNPGGAALPRRQQPNLQQLRQYFIQRGHHARQQRERVSHLPALVVSHSDSYRRGWQYQQRLFRIHQAGGRDQQPMALRQSDGPHPQSGHRRNPGRRCARWQLHLRNAGRLRPRLPGSWHNYRHRHRHLRCRSFRLYPDRVRWHGAFTGHRAACRRLGHGRGGHQNGRSGDLGGRYLSVTNFG